MTDFYIFAYLILYLLQRNEVLPAMEAKEPIKSDPNAGIDLPDLNLTEISEAIAHKISNPDLLDEVNKLNKVFKENRDLRVDKTVEVSTNHPPDIYNRTVIDFKYSTAVSFLFSPLTSLPSSTKLFYQILRGFISRYTLQSVAMFLKS